MKILKLHSKDNVAVTLCELGRGVEVEIEGKSVTLQDNIPYGHKFALCDINEGEDIIKYGESIGGASAEIKCGEHVHIHNLKSKRARGNLSPKL